MSSARATAYKALDPLIGGTIDMRVIAENWDEILRLAASIKAGTVAPSAILRRLAAYPRQNALAKSLKEIGRLERTLFMLDWISDPALRRRTNAGLNKGEARNALARAVFFHRLGEIRDRTFENQRYRASGLNLAVAAIILWNTVYLGRAVDELRSRGEIIPDDLARPRRAARLGAYRFQRRLRLARPSRSQTASDRYEIRAPNSSMPLSVLFREDSTMTPSGSMRSKTAARDSSLCRRTDRPCSSAASRRRRPVRKSIPRSPGAPPTSSGGARCPATSRSLESRDWSVIGRIVRNTLRRRIDQRLARRRMIDPEEHDLACKLVIRWLVPVSIAVATS